MFSLNSPRRPERRQINEFASHILDLNFDCQTAQAPLLWQPPNLPWPGRGCQGVSLLPFHRPYTDANGPEGPCPALSTSARVARPDPHLSGLGLASQPLRKQNQSGVGREPRMHLGPDMPTDGPTRSCPQSPRVDGEVGPSPRFLVRSPPDPIRELPQKIFLLELARDSSPRRPRRRRRDPASIERGPGGVRSMGPAPFRSRFRRGPAIGDAVPIGGRARSASIDELPHASGILARGTEVVSMVPHEARAQVAGTLPSTRRFRGPTLG